jgi:MFS family permease
MAVAIVFFFANLLGLGLGPIIAGSLSDHFAANHGPAEGLRYALIITMTTFLPGGLFMLRAARTLKADAED